MNPSFDFEAYDEVCVAVEYSVSNLFKDISVAKGTLFTYKCSRDVDASVASQTMSWWNVHKQSEACADNANNWRDDYMGSYHGVRTLVPSYSSCIEDAWKVVNQIMKSYSREITIEYGWSKYPGPYWHCHMGLFDGVATTPSMAISMTALLVSKIHRRDYDLAQ